MNRNALVRYGSVCAILAALAVGAYWLSPPAPYSEAATIAEGAKGSDELTARFTGLAREKGGAYAFEVLKRAPLPVNTDTHLLGHAVGTVLYEQKGAGAIAECTQDFRNACSHSVVIGTLNDYGAAALDMVRDACKQAPGGSGAYTMCYHGLGHGVFAYFGYDLAQTVDFCKKTATPERRDREYIECVGGAIMELVGGGGHDRDAWILAREKYFRDDDPLLPCMSDAIPDETKAQCLIYLTPRLWERIGIDFDHIDPHVFARAAEACDAIPAARQDLRDACYGGFGKEFIVIAGGRDVRSVDAYPDETYRKAIGWCASFPDGGAQACIAEAIDSVFWGGENDPEASFRFCALAQAPLDGACYGSLAKAIGAYAGDARAALCARVPQDYQAACAGS